MTVVHQFEVVLLLIAACVGLTVLAKRLHVPHAGALIIGGLAIALLPGMPAIELDPELKLVLFLPPLLLLSAYMTDWRTFRADLRIITQLAVGAVAFTTFAVRLDRSLGGARSASCCLLRVGRDRLATGCGRR